MATNPRVIMKEERIVFFGTPGFASHQLQYLIDNNMPVVGVVTTPDRPQGRGRKLQPCAVKEVALANNLPVLEPNNLKAPEFQVQLQALKPTLQIVVAFRMLPKSVWDYPKRGTLNLHASYLPQYRGAAPINRCIMDGASETGISTFLLQHEIDTGNVLLRTKVPIDKTETAGSLHDKLMNTGAPLLLNTIEKLVEGSIEAIPQATLLKEGETIQHAPKIFKEDCRIDFNQEPEIVCNHIRGLSPYPGAFTPVLHNGKDSQLKIWMAIPNKTGHNIAVGSLQENSGKLLIGVKNGAISVEKLQLSGKQSMKTGDFLRGIQLKSLEIAL